MPLFDQSIIIRAPRTAVVEQLKRSLLPGDHSTWLREAPVLVVVREDFGYVFVVSSEVTGATRVRLLGAKADQVRNAFRGHAMREALEALEKTATMTHSPMVETAAAMLAAVAAETAPLAEPEKSARTLTQRVTAFLRLPPGWS